MLLAPIPARPLAPSAIRTSHIFIYFIVVLVHVAQEDNCKQRQHLFQQGSVYSAKTRYLIELGEILEVSPNIRRQHHLYDTATHRGEFFSRKIGEDVDLQDENDSTQFSDSKHLVFSRIEHPLTITYLTAVPIVRDSISP